MTTTKRPRPGPRCLYANKVRQPLSILLTPHAHGMLSREMARTRLKRHDLIETLIRRFGRRVPATLSRSLRVASPR